MSSESGGQNPISTVEQNPGEPIPPPLETSSGKITDNDKDNGQSLDDESDEPPPLEELSGDSVTAGQSQPDQSGDGSQQDAEFPLDHLAKLDDQLNRPKWVVPVRPDDDLERLLRAAVKLCREGRDVNSEPCQRFFREGLTTSFIRILTDDAVSTWKPDIQRDIYNNSVLLVELCVTKLEQDWFVLLDLLALVLNPNSKWHSFNRNQPSDTCTESADLDSLYAVPIENKHNQEYGWLLDMINIFGQFGGFKMLHNRIINGENLTVPLIAALIKPFGHCAEFLVERVYEEVLIPVVDKIITFLNELSDEALKKEATTEAKSDTFSSIMKSLRHLCRRVPAREDIESFRLKMILRLLQISSFSGKMNALNEINKIVPTVTYHPHFRPQDDDQMQADKLSVWIRENNVLAIVFRDNLHQAQYVEKLDRLVRFCIKEKVLSLDDLDRIWSAQDGKHEIIVKNIHDMLVKLAWDFSPEQLDYLFGCFQRSWVGASKKQRDELLDFIRHLAEDDKEGVMATKVLELLWNLAHRDDCPTDTMDHALNAHIKILDYSCSQERESQKLKWLQRCVDELSNEKWVIPALKQMREICLLYLESPINYVHHHRSNHFYYRNEIISHLDTNYHLLSHICQNMENYIRKVRQVLDNNPEQDPELLCLDGRFNHHMQLQNRLDFIRFALKDGQLWLGHQQALMVWESLAENPAFPSDRDACFKWFAKLVSDEPDIEPETAKKIFTENVHKIPPQHLTENGFRCFDRFFRMVNINERRLVAWRRGFVTEKVDLVGLEYLWKAVLVAPDNIVYKPIELLRDVYTNLSPKLQQDQIHLEFIQVCMQQLQIIYESLQQYKPGEIEQEPPEVQQGCKAEVNKLVRCLTLLKEYAMDCDEEYGEERGIPPHTKSWWGKPFVLIVRYIPHHAQAPEDFEIWTHTNECLALVRRHILQKLKMSFTNRLELSVGNEVLRPNEDRRLVSAVPLRDRMVITAKIVNTNVSETSMNSSDNSTDSSDGSPTAHLEGPNLDSERVLPSVLIAGEEKNMNFLLTLCDFAVEHKLQVLRDSVRNLLKLLPTGIQLWSETLEHCKKCVESNPDKSYENLRKYLITSSPSKTLYLLEVVHSLLMPSVDCRETDSMHFQAHFVHCGGLKLLLNILVDKNFMSQADNSLKRSALLSVMKMLKLLLLSSAYAIIVKVVQDIKLGTVTEERHHSAQQLQSTLEHIILTTEQRLKNASTQLAKQHFEKLLSPLPDISVVKSLQLLGWSAACGDISLAQNASTIHQYFLKHGGVRGLDSDDTYLAKDSLEVLCLCLVISPSILEALQNSQDWRHFVTDVLMLTKNRLIRVSACDQFFYIVTKANSNSAILVSFISQLFSAVETVAKDHAPTSGEFFRLLARLLNHTHLMHVPIQGVNKLLEVELKWLLNVREETLKTHQCPVESPLLDGHLSLIVELLSFRTISERYRIGGHPEGDQLIKKLVLDFMFPASRLVKEARENPNKIEYGTFTTPICNSTDTTLSAFKLINALCMGCVENIKTLQGLLNDLFYSDHELPIVEWEHLPHIGPRPLRGFVGLKNAGATCYMNSVLQQLYMIPPVRKGILDVEEPARQLRQLEEEESRREKEREANRRNREELLEPSDEQPLPSPSSDSDRKDTHKKVLMQLQSIFGHLMEGKLQFHVPKGFWRDFRLWGERVNLREQHDAFEFFNCLVDSLDEGLKAYGSLSALARVLGGSFADQKICKGCPHRYSREEPFTALNVDIRNKQHLYESLDAFVKGDLLEGANAYHCEKCDKKVDTVKRMCVKRLPKVLVIQLKRFDYDWEREMAVKFNDYFEFPRELDMSPYTAATLAEKEGEAPSDAVNDDDNLDNRGEEKLKKQLSNEGESKKEEDDKKTPGDEPGEGVSTKYRLRGIVVHSGQASGGHYYSFIQIRPPGSNSVKWFKFDDGEVTEAKIDDEEEFKAQCFGGEFTGEVYDHVLKKTHYRRQKRWWSAYLLFFDRLDQEKVFDESMQKMCPVPQPIQVMVQKQNLEFHHTKSHFSYPYFQFMKQLLTINYNYIRMQVEQSSLTNTAAELEELGLLCVQIVTKFLFHCGFHTKKTLRGPAIEWYEALHPYLMFSAKIRRWFMETVFCQHKERFSEFLLECPSTEIRSVFAKMITFLCWVSNKDSPFEVEVTTNAGMEKAMHQFSEIALNNLLQLLKKEVSDHSRHLNQYFQVFLNYANKGPYERQQLIRLGVPSLFIAVSLDEGPGPPMRSPYTDLTKLYATVSILVRCCNVTPLQKSLHQDKEPLANPYADTELTLSLPNDLHHWLYERTNTQHATTYIKKVIEDNCTMEETVRFLAFCCWENWPFSMVVINELLIEIGSVQAFDMRPYLDLLMHLLLMQDTWQQHRLVTSLKGFTHHSDGLIVIIQHGQTHYQKRAYLCIKFIIQVCNRCAQLQQILLEDSYMKQQWQNAIHWLQNEMERRPYVGTGYSYAGWSPPAQSNEASNGYFLERSNSAKLTLKRAQELFPVEETATEDAAEEDQGIVPGGDPDAGMPAEQAEIHGTQRGSPPPTEGTESGSHPPASDGLDNIEVENNVEEGNDTKVVTQPPDSD